MCGIMGYVGAGDCVGNIRDGLLKEEYRGYDSAGISYVYENRISVQKRVGGVKHLFENIVCPEVNAAIGHTRWATHGAVCEKNAHPHLSFNNKFSLVHNGIIENYENIKNGELVDVPFRTDVDSEVIVNLTAVNYETEKDVLKAFQKAIKKLNGSFAVAMISVYEKDKIFFARVQSPLLIGKGENGFYVASDILGFGADCKTYSVVPDGVYGYFSKDEIVAFDSNDNRFSLPFESVGNIQEKAELGEYKHFMQKEIEETTTVIKRTAMLYLNEENPFKKIGSGFFDGIERVEFVACGTSYHACKVGAVFVEDDAKIISRTHVASEFVYDPPFLNNKTLVVFVSQSGETADTLLAVSTARKKGARTLAVTNVPKSNITRVCDFTLPIEAGTEVAVASTKAYNAQVTVLLLLAEYLKCGDYSSLANRIINAADSFNMQESWKVASKFVKQIKNASSVFFVGRHMDYITCLESSLKLKEISYIPCEAYAAGELKHGTISLIEEGTTIIAIVTEPRLITKTKNIVDQAKSRGANVIFVSSLDKKEYNIPESKLLRVPKVEVELSPLITIIPMQMLAYLVSVAKGNNPDRPRNLAKSVTVQ